MYGIDVFDSWLYDEDKPFDYLRQLQIFDGLKKKMTEGYFENLVKTCLLGSSHRAVLTVKPQKGLAREREKQLEDQLAAYKASLNEEQLQQLARQTRALTKYQEAPRDAGGAGLHSHAEKAGYQKRRTETLQ